MLFVIQVSTGLGFNSCLRFYGLGLGFVVSRTAAIDDVVGIAI